MKSSEITMSMFSTKDEMIEALKTELFVREVEVYHLRKALDCLVKAEDDYTKDTQIELDDPISDAVDFGRSVLWTAPELLEKPKGWE